VAAGDNYWSYVIALSPHDVLGSAPFNRYLFSGGLFVASFNVYGAMALGILAAKTYPKTVFYILIHPSFCFNQR